VSVKLSALHLEVNDCLQSISQHEDIFSSAQLDNEYRILMVFLDNILLLDLTSTHLCNVPGLVKSIQKCTELKGEGDMHADLVEKSNKFLQNCKYILHEDLNMYQSSVQFKETEDRINDSKSNISTMTTCQNKMEVACTESNITSKDNDPELTDVFLDYHCAVCNDSFLTKALCTSHMSIHTGGKPYYCVKCRKAFPKLSHLSQHITELHTKDKFYKCHQCTEAFGSWRELAGHCETHHSGNNLAEILCNISESGVKPNDQECNINDTPNVQTCTFSDTGVKPNNQQYHISDTGVKLDDQEFIRIHGNLFTPELTQNKDVKIELPICDDQSSTTNAPLENLISSTLNCKPSNNTESSQVSAPSAAINGVFYKTSYKCIVCDKTFTEGSHLSAHVENDHPNELDMFNQLRLIDMKVYNCTVCAYSTTSKCALNMHIRDHTGFRPYECKICNKSFKQISHFKHHQRKHEDMTDNLYTCKICDVTFKWSVSLKNHEKLHDEGENFPCEFCDKTFVGIRYLKDHMHVHKLQQFKCKYCIKSFARKEKLVIHEKHHKGDKQFQCVVCNKSYARKCDLTRHLQSHFENNTCKQFECKICKNTFSSLADLRQHRTSEHSEKYQCKLCDHGDFHSKIELAVHKKNSHAKPFVCQYCSQSFARKHALFNHEKRHRGEKPYQCGYCEKAFVTTTLYKQHQYLHKGEKPFKCEFCTKAFVTKSHLSRHQNVHCKGLGDVKTNDQEYNRTTNVNPYVEKSFQTHDNFLMHEGMHSGNGQYNYAW